MWDIIKEFKIEKEKMWNIDGQLVEDEHIKVRAYIRDDTDDTRMLVFEVTDWFLEGPPTYSDNFTCNTLEKKLPAREFNWLVERIASGMAQAVKNSRDQTRKEFGLRMKEMFTFGGVEVGKEKK